MRSHVVYEKCVSVHVESAASRALQRRAIEGGSSLHHVTHHISLPQAHLDKSRDSRHNHNGCDGETRSLQGDKSNSAPLRGVA